MTPERLAEIEAKLRELLSAGNTHAAHQEREDFLTVEVPELIAALKAKGKK